MNDFIISWRKISYKLCIQLIGKTAARSELNNGTLPHCLIVDDTDLPKTGRRNELIGKVFSQVTRQSGLAFKALFLGYHDGKSFFAVNFSLHGEGGKNKKKPYGLTTNQLKCRFSKHRDKNSSRHKRKGEYFTTKIQSMIEMVLTAISNGLRFDNLFVDSLFTCFALVKFIQTRRFWCQLLGMAKMGKTRYLFSRKKLTAIEIVDYQRKTKN